MKFKFSLLFALMLVFTACEEEDPCDTVTCFNDGTCVNGECDCTEAWTGPDCSSQVKPANIRLTKITVTSFPATNSNGGAWDGATNNGADIYPVVTDNNGNNVLINLQSQFVTNADPNQPHGFTLSGPGFQFPDVSANYNFLLYDDEGTLAAEVMGGINGPIYTSTNNFPNPIVLELNDYRFELEVVYTY